MKKLNEDKFEPTLDEPTSDQAIEFQDDFDDTMILKGINLQEMDVLLTEKQQSLKKKIFSLAKMEALVHPDPRLAAVYDEMAENGEEKYGYHYNETIMNIIFNDYILNDAKYLEKYKQAVPKKKKRRDKSGINKLKKDAEQMDKRRAEMKKEKQQAQPPVAEQEADAEFVLNNSQAYGSVDNMNDANQKIIKNDIENRQFNKPNLKTTDIPLQEEKEIDETTSAGAGATGSGANADYTYVGPGVWGGGDLMKGGKKTKKDKESFWKGGEIISETNYLVDPSGFEKYSKILNENMESTGKISTMEELKALGRKITKEDIPNLAGEALHHIAIKLANRYLPISWDDLGDTNSMWDYIDEAGDMSFEALMIAVKEASNDRIGEEGFDMDMLGEQGGVQIDGMDQLISSIEMRGGVSKSMVQQIAQKNGMEVTDVLRAVVDAVKQRQGSYTLNEKAKSKAQQRFMGAVNAYKNGDLADASPEIERAAQSMSDIEVKKMAGTKHDGLPDHVDEDMYDSADSDYPPEEEDRNFVIKAFRRSNAPEDLQDYDELEVQEFVERIDDFGKSRMKQLRSAFERTLNRMGVDPQSLTEQMGQPDIDYLVNAFTIANSGPNFDPTKVERFKNNIGQMDPQKIQQVQRTLDGIMRQMGYDTEQVKNYTSMNEDHLDSREQKIEFIRNGVKHIAGNRNLGYDSGWDQKTDDQIDMFYQEVEKGLREKGIDPESLSENPMLKGLGLAAASGAGQAIGGRIADKVGLEEDHMSTTEDKRAFITKAVQHLMGSDQLPKFLWGLDKASDEEVQAYYEKAEALLREKGIDPESLGEAESMIDNKDNSMKMGEPIGTQGSGDFPRGFQTGGGSMMENKNINIMDENMKELEKINEDLEKLQQIHNDLNEDRKPSTLVMKDRLGNENDKNFKADLKHSGTKEIIDTTKELAGKDNSWADQQTDVGKDPMKLGADIEKEVLKNTKGDALKNVGDSANYKGDEIPKRNLTGDEQDEVDLYRKGLGD